MSSSENRFFAITLRADWKIDKNVQEEKITNSNILNLIISRSDNLQAFLPLDSLGFVGELRWDEFLPIQSLLELLSLSQYPDVPSFAISFYTLKTYSNELERLERKQLRNTSNERRLRTLHSIKLIERAFAIWLMRNFRSQLFKYKKKHLHASTRNEIKKFTEV